MYGSGRGSTDIRLQQQEHMQSAESQVMRLVPGFQGTNYPEESEAIPSGAEFGRLELKEGCCLAQHLPFLFLLGGR